jgi:hypothetical protein
LTGRRGLLIVRYGKVGLFSKTGYGYYLVEFLMSRYVIHSFEGASYDALLYLSDFGRLRKKSKEKYDNYSHIYKNHDYIIVCKKESTCL